MFCLVINHHHPPILVKCASFKRVFFFLLIHEASTLFRMNQTCPDFFHRPEKLVAKGKGTIYEPDSISCLKSATEQQGQAVVVVVGTCMMEFCLRSSIRVLAGPGKTPSPQHPCLRMILRPTCCCFAIRSHVHLCPPFPFFNYKASLNIMPHLPNVFSVCE